MGPHEYRFINLFRALAAFWVLAAHSQIWGGYRWLPIPDPKIAVDLFMLVSGFLMAANADARWMREPMTSAASRLRFWTRRFFRIAPAYYLCLLVLVLGADVFLAGKSELQALNPGRWVAGGKYDPTLTQLTAGNLFAHVTFAFGLIPKYASATSLPDWSIGLEMQFYFMFPLLCIFMRRYGVAALTLFGVGVYLLGAWVNEQIVYPEPSMLAFKLHIFVAGMLLHEALKPAGAARRIGVIFCAVFLASLGHPLVPVMLLAMLALGLMEAEGNSPLEPIVSSRVVRFASDASYSVYLFQGFFVGLFGALCIVSPWLRDLTMGARTVLLFLFTVAGAYASAAVIYRYVELPGIRLGRRLLQRPDGKAMRASM